MNYNKRKIWQKRISVAITVAGKASRIATDVQTNEIQFPTDSTLFSGLY